ncbi:AraC-like DNA-binding protein [Flavobacteriaceae bacterium MAR_2009_75]|nr:AraC-like DNA-binding protein [Flavobacteriaceae bacterium MAR_2009_75]
MDNRNIKQGFLGQKMVVLPNSIQQRLHKSSISKEFYITDIGFYPKAEGHYIHRKKGCKEYIFIYCIEGSGSVQFDGTKFQLNPNTYCIIPIKTVHSYYASKAEPWSIYWMHFRGELCDSLYQRHCESKSEVKNVHFESERISQFNQIFDMLNSEYGSNHLEFANILGLKFLSSFIYTEVDQTLNTRNHNNIVDSIKIFLNENLDKSFKADEIAEKFNYSSSYLFNLFKKRTGYSLIHFFNLKKIQKGCEYLKYTDLSIKEISFKLGFHDPLYFSRMFKKYMGVPPRKYRKENS